MSIILNGTTGITTPDVTSDGSLKIDASAPDDSLVVNSAGNVGINTTSPNGKLQVKQANTAYGLVVEASGNDAWVRFHHNDSVGIVESTYDTSAGYTPLTFKTGGSERLRILSTGGITFNGDTAAANALDDYEEGTWTPTSPTAGYTFSSASGTYIKIGKMVYVSCSLTFSAVPASNSSCAFSGMPFTPSNTTAGTFRDNSVTGTIYVFRIATSFEINSMDGVTAGSNRTIRINESYVGFAVYEI